MYWPYTKKDCDPPHKFYYYYYYVIRIRVEKGRAYPEFELAARIHNSGKCALRAVHDWSSCTSIRLITFPTVS